MDVILGDPLTQIFRETFYKSKDHFSAPSECTNLGVTRYARRLFYTHCGLPVSWVYLYIGPDWAEWVLAP